MHVLSVIYYPVFGGPYNRNSKVAPVLAQQGVKTTMLLPHDAGESAERLRKFGLDVVLMPLTRVRATRDIGTHLRYVFGFPGQVRAIRDLIRKLDIDVVQINGLANPHAAIAAYGLGVPVVWQVIDTYTPVLLRKVLAPMLRRYADVVMCTGQQVADAHPGVPTSPDRLVNFYPPVDVRRFCADPAARVAAREAFGIRPTELVVGTVGNINLQKGHENFIRAAAALRKRVPDSKFLMLGAQSEAHRAHIDGLWKLADELGLKLGQDLFTEDPTGRVNQLLQAMDVFWMTPRPLSEGIPTAMEEAMAVGLPVVSFDVGSISELVREGVSGYVVAQQDPDAVADLTVRHLLDPSRRIEMGRAGRSFIEANASVERCAETHMHAYELAQQRRSSQRPRTATG